jgi:RNA polymerase sigma factor (sigma-70 family)
MNSEKLEAALRDIRNLVKMPGEECIADEELVRRYADGREEAAFAALVRRYGPMVLRVCYRVLHQSHDAEDAFQATFLTLAREAASLRRFDAVGSWIHGVAYHAALRVRQRLARQRQRDERYISPKTDNGPDEGILREDVQAALYEELHRLPEKYRIPLVLCNLMGRTQDEVARELGLHRTALSKRLKRAYSQLRQRLLSRGIALSMILLASLLHEEGKAASLPTALLLRTVRAALETASASAAALTATGTSAYVIGAVKNKYVLGALVLLLAGGGYWAQRAWNTPKPEHADAAAVLPLPEPPVSRRASPPVSQNVENITLSGTVVDAGGTPVPRAEVAVCGLHSFRPGKRNVRDEVLARGRADDAGRFQMHVPRPDSAWSLRTAFVHLWAAAPGHAPASVRLPWRPDSLVEVRLHCPEKIVGQLIGADSRPAAQVQILVSDIGAIHWDPIQGRDRADRSKPALWPAPVTTDAQGRFQLHGLHLEQGIGLCIHDDRYALRRVVLEPARWRGQERTLHLTPARVLEGRVLADGGATLPAARLRVLVYDAARRQVGSALEARADAGGAFRIHLTLGDRYEIEAIAPDGAPYSGIVRQLRWPEEATRQQLDLCLPRGILVHGAVRDADSSQPIPKVDVQFRPLDDTAIAPEILTGWSNPTRSDRDGSFRLVVPKANGLLFVHEPSGDYVMEEWTGRLRAVAGQLHANRVLAVDAACGPEMRELGVVLRRGVRIEGRIVRPDGEPAGDGAWIGRGRTCPEDPGEGQPQPYWNGRFVLRGCVPGRVYPLFFLDARHRLGAKVKLRAADDGKPVEVRLQPCGTAEVRFVDAGGRPVAGYQPFLFVMVPSDRSSDEEDDSEPAAAAAHKRDKVDPEHTDSSSPNNWPPRTAEMHELDELDPDHYRDGPRTDAEGRVSLPALIPGVRYRMSHYLDADGRWDEFETAAGQSLSLPDVVLPHRRATKRSSNP